MKAEDVVQRLKLVTPNYTDIFSDVFTITSIVALSGTVTVTTAEQHGLAINKPVHVSGVSVPISQNTLSRLLTVGTLVTAVDHDLTLPIAPTITISGAADSNFNGEFVVTQIVNRRTIKFAMADSGATSTTGASLAGAARFDQEFNGFHQVLTVPTLTTFTYSLSTALNGTASAGSVKTNNRITAAATVERAVLAYTEQQLTKAWAFAVLGDSSASKDRHTNTDLTSNQTKSNEYRQQIQELLSIVVIANTKDEIAGREIRDTMLDVFRSFTRAIAFHRFPTEMHVGTSDPMVFVNHGLNRYDGAIYVHEFNFECSTEFVFDDTAGYDDDVAFRDIDMTQDSNLGSTTADALMNLDEVAL